MMGWTDRTVRVRVPATSANLGPGFDTLGLALTLYDQVEARIMPSGLSIDVSGEGESTAGAGEGHLVVRAMRAAFDVLGGQPPGIALRCENRIPHGRGLGSSAAAIGSGILAARALAGGGQRRADDQVLRHSGGDRLPGEMLRDDGSERLPGDEVLRLAARMEGHPDNVAACLLGGLTVAWQAAGSPHVARLFPLPAVVPVACIAPAPLSTEAARGVLPSSVPHADAAANAGRSALLVACLTSEACLAGGPGALLDATQDFLHQAYRAVVMPGTADLVARLRDAGIPAVISGAGPSVLAFLVREPPASADADVPGGEQPDGERPDVERPDGERMGHGERGTIRQQVPPRDDRTVPRDTGVRPPRDDRAALPRTPAQAPGLPGLDVIDSIASETGTAWHVRPLDVDRQGGRTESVTPGALPVSGTSD